MSSEKTSWTTERVARLGFLVGQGFGAKRIAEDPFIASTPKQCASTGSALRPRLSRCDGDGTASAARGRCPLRRRGG